MSFLPSKLESEFCKKRVILELKEYITNVSILSVCIWILLIFLKLEKLNGIQIQLNIVVVLSNSEFLYLSDHFSDLSVHDHFEVWTNSC